MRWGNVLGSAATAFKETQTWMQEQQARNDELLKAKALREAASGAADFSPDVKAWMAGRDGSTATASPLGNAVSWVGKKLGLDSGADAATNTPATGLPTTSATSGAAANASNTVAGLPTNSPGAAPPGPVTAPTAPAPAAPAATAPAAPAPAAPAASATPAATPTASALPPRAMPTGAANAIPPGTPPQMIHDSSTQLASAGYTDPATERMIAMYMKVDPEIGMSMKTNYLNQQLVGMQLDNAKFKANFTKAMQLYSGGDTSGALTQLQATMQSVLPGSKVQINPPDKTGRVVVNSTDADGIVHQQFFVPGKDASGRPISALDNMFTTVAAAQDPATFLSYKVQQQQLALQAKEVQARLSEAGAAWYNAKTNAARTAVENQLTAEQTGALHLQNTINTQINNKLNIARQILSNPQATPAMKAQATQDMSLYGGFDSKIGTYIKPDQTQGTYVEMPGGIKMVQDTAGHWVNMNADQRDLAAAYGDKGTVVNGQRWYVSPYTDNTGMPHFKIQSKEGKAFNNNTYDSAADAFAALDASSSAGTGDAVRTMTGLPLQENTLPTGTQ